MPAPSVPNRRWAAVAEELARRLAQGTYVDRFPSESMLTAEFGVSRDTVRRALRHLRTQELLDARQGARTVITDREDPRHPFGVRSLALGLQAIGVVESSIVRHLDVRPAGMAARYLNVGRDEDVVYVERLRLGDGEALALDRSWLPAGDARPLLDADLTTGSLYEALVTTCGRRVTAGREELKPTLATTADQRILGVSSETVILVLERIASCASHRIEYRVSRLRSDRYALSSTWGDPGGTVTRDG